MPSPLVCPGLLFQTVSELAVFFVPPAPMMCGHPAGKSTFAAVGPPSLESLSPAAATTGIPAAVAEIAAFSMSMAAGLPHSASSAPQEIEHTSHPSAVALRTAVAMSCAQYTRICGVLPPVRYEYTSDATWMSSATSPSASPPGVFLVPSTETSVMLGATLPLKYVAMSVGVQPPPSSTIAMMPPPGRLVGKPYALQRSVTLHGPAPAARGRFLLATWK